MPRELRTAAEIHAEVQRRIDRRRCGGADVIHAHLPTPLAELDERGCNWTMHDYTGDRGHFRLIGLAILETKDRMNLG